MINVLLFFSMNTGNLERRFRDYRESRPAERASLLDATVEDILLADMAPPSDAWGPALNTTSTATVEKAGPVAAMQVYMRKLVQLHAARHGAGLWNRRGQKQRMGQGR